MPRIVCALALALVTACSTTSSPITDPKHPAPDVTLGIGLLVGGASAESAGASQDFSGGAVGGRLDVTAPTSDSGMVELGLRVGLVGASLEPELIPFGGRHELDARQIQVAPMARFWFLDREETVRPYCEAFVGYQSTDFEERYTISGLTTSLDYDDSGLFAGLGLGVAIRLSETSGTQLVLGGEWEHSEFRDLDGSSDGIFFHAGTRWEF